MTSLIAATADRNRYWPGGRVPYVIEPSLNESRRQMLKEAMEQFNATCVRYVERTNEPRFIHFLNQQNISCYTEIGMAPSSADPSGQPLNLGGVIGGPGFFKHMLLHPLGFWHEEMRQDRDHHIDIFYDNIKDGEEGGFLKLALFGDEIYRTPYDTNSLMHTGSYAYSKDRGKLKTQQAKNGTFLQSAYVKPGVDDIDLDRINRLYNC